MCHHPLISLEAKSDPGEILDQLKILPARPLPPAPGLSAAQARMTDRRAER
jgi:hypothetical protein